MDRRRPRPAHRSLHADERGDLPGAATTRILENPEIRGPRDDHDLLARLASIRDIRGAGPLSGAPGAALPHRHPDDLAGRPAHRIRTAALAVHANRRAHPRDHGERIVTLHPWFRG